MQKPDFANDMLRHCGGRITVQDADLLFETSMFIQAKNILEIGSADGCSTMVFGSVAREMGGKLQCIDPHPKKQWAWNVERLQLQEWVEMIKGSSPWIPLNLIRQPIDYLFIDGDHRTRWAMVDYHYWSRFVRIGGRIAFHDWGDQHEAGKCVREAVEIILRDDAEKVLKKIGETKTTSRGTVVFEKVGI